MRDRDGSDDLVLSILRMVVDEFPAIASNVIIEVETLARRTFGGRRCYVRHSSAPRTRGDDAEGST